MSLESVLQFAFTTYVVDFPVVPVVGYIVTAVFVVVAVEGNLGGSVDRYPVDFIVDAVLGFVVKVKIVKNS